MPEPDEGAVSVIIPARNEENNIERVVRSVASQRHVREIIVVDDGSTDRTGKVLAELCAEIPLLRTLRINTLPEGWVGKSHAAAAGAETATGEWLLFTDADTEHLPGGLEAMLARAGAVHADLVSLSPGQQTATWWEKSIIPFIFVQLARLYPFEEVNDLESPRAAANGQYLLIRRSLYDKVGGHGAVRNEILDDVELARRVKSAGGKLLFLPGAEWVRTRMYRTFCEMWQGWSKNLYLLYDRKRWLMFKSLAGTLCLSVLFPLGLLAMGILIVAGQGTVWPLLGAVFCYVGLTVRQRIYSRNLARLGYDRGLATYEFVGALLFTMLLLNSMWAYSVAGGVRWKGRNYQTSGQGRRME